jgi:glycerophosphoryl diester phosphodiesterase
MPTAPLLLGHRGVRGKDSTPENTLPAFDLALAAGCDGFEFDVRLSVDAQAVCCHDPKTRGRQIADCSSGTLALPLLREVLQKYRSTAFLDIELKVEGLEAITLDLLRSHPLGRGYVISSFSPAVLDAVHRVDAGIPLGLICDTKAQFSLWSKLPVQYVIPHHQLIRQNEIADLKNNGRKVLVWTVNSTTDMKRFADWGVDGIISDDPAKLVRILHDNRHEKK